jgi:branched-subunit amino acid ABC-type transport system permease component
VVSGLGIGAVYVVLGLSYNLILSVSGIFNFAQGSLVMAGTFLAFFMLASFRIPVVAAILLACGCGLLGGYLCEAIAVKPLYGRTPDAAFAAVLTTLGLGLAAENGAAVLFSANAKSVPSYLPGGSVLIKSVPVQPIFMVTIAMAVLVSGTLEVGLRKTALGRELRACLEDRVGAEIAGIDTRLVVRIIFSLAGLLAVVAGFLVAPVTSASPFAADSLAFYAFAGLAIGGFGSFRGALIGGLIVGLASSLIPVYLGTHLALPVIWILVVAILVARPRGLFGAAGAFGAAGGRRV